MRSEFSLAGLWYVEIGIAHLQMSDTNASSQQAAILIFGMHRSGTSALTRMLSLLGCELPKTLMRPNQYNAPGYWESERVCALNDRILKSVGSSWKGWRSLQSEEGEAPRLEAFENEAQLLLREEFGDSDVIVLKDPRLCRIAPFWLHILETAGIQPKALFTIRHPFEVATSLETRDRMGPGLSCLIWLHHVLEAEHATRHVPRVFTSYDQLLLEKAGVGRRAGEQFGISWPNAVDEVADEIAGFLSGKYRHSQLDRDGKADADAMAGWLRDAFQILTKWAEFGEDSANHDRLDEIRTAFGVASATFAPAVDEGEKARTELHALEQVSQTEKRRSAARIAELEMQLQEKQAELETQLRAARATLEMQLRETGAEHEMQLRDSRAELETQLRETRAKLATQLREKQAEIERGRADRAKLQAALEAHLAQSTELSHRLRDEEAKSRNSAAMLDRMRKAASGEFGKAVVQLLQALSRPVLGKQFRLWLQTRVLRGTGVFDGQWYVNRYQDLAQAQVDPERHYIEYGAQEGREPNAAFAKAMDEVVSD